MNKLDPNHKIIDLSFEEIKPMGFIPPEEDKRDFKFGATTKIPDVILREDGQYLDVQIEKEYQRKYGTETMGCTFFGTNNAVEIISKVKYPEDTEMNNCDRAGNILAGNTKNGNNPKKPAEVLNNIGIPKEEDLPFDESCNTWEKYHSPKPLPQNLLSKCKEWHDKYLLLYAWVNTDKQSLMEGLKRSPLGISVTAWRMRNGMYYNDSKGTNNHWCTLIGYEDGKCWYIFDSYSGFIKKLEWDYKFDYAMQYYLEKKYHDTIEKPTDNYWKVLKSKTGKKYFVQSNTFKKTLLWINDKDNTSWADYKILEKHGLVKLTDEIDDALLPSYKVEPFMINGDLYSDENTSFSALFKALLKKLGLY